MQLLARGARLARPIASSSRRSLAVKASAGAKSGDFVQVRALLPTQIARPAMRTSRLLLRFTHRLRRARDGPGRAATQARQPQLLIERV